jgi:CubicO group peptidase (beta-lactamase class C family)
VRAVQREAPGWYFAAGELCMTPSDLSKWDIAFLQRKLLSQRSYEEFTREVILTDGKRSRYALGLTVSDVGGVPVYSHGGEVSGFLASNQIFPTKKAAVIVLSNSDGLNLTGPLSAELVQIVLNGESATVPEKEIREITAILEALQQGLINRKLFTPNANSYFNEVALGDFQASLSALGKLKGITRTNDSLRGGMIHRSYRAVFEKKTVLLNVYLMPDGKYEQILVTEQR